MRRHPCLRVDPSVPRRGGWCNIASGVSLGSTPLQLAGKPNTPIAVGTSMSETSSDDQIVTSVGSYLLQFKRLLFQELAKAHPTKNQIYRLVENYPLSAFEKVFAENPTLVTERRRNCICRTVILGDQGSVDRLLSLQTVDSSRAFGAFRFTREGELSGVCPPLKVRHFQHTNGEFRLKVYYNKVAVKLNSTASIGIHVPQTRGEWGLTPIVNLRYKKDLPRHNRFKLTAPELLLKKLTAEAGLKLLARFPEAETEITKAELEGKLLSYKKQFLVRSRKQVSYIVLVLLFWYY